MSAPVNNYIKVSKGCAVVATFPFDDRRLRSASEAHRAAVKCLDRTIEDVVAKSKQATLRNVRRPVVRMSIYKPCELLSGVFTHEVGSWRCPVCFADGERCRCRD